MWFYWYNIVTTKKLQLSYMHAKQRNKQKKTVGIT